MSPRSSQSFVVATVYVSEKSAEHSLSLLAKHKGTKLLSHFVDAVYERCSYSLGGPGTTEAVAALAMDALDRLNLENHKGSHPRLGVVDHVSCFPLGSATLEDAAETARRVAHCLSSRLPVLLYGAAHHSQRSLAETRRLTSYFRNDYVTSEIRPDLGPAAIDPRSGLLCCGATHHVLNYNIQLSDCTLTTAKKIASAVRTRAFSPDSSSRLRGLEALALSHNNLIEIACNLLDADATPPSAVLDRVTLATQEHGAKVTGHYVIGRTKPQLLDDLINASFPPSSE